MDAALADESYWTSVWSSTATSTNDATPKIVSGATTRWRTELFRKFLSPGRRFIEIGAAGSAWPGYVATETGAEAWGIDFAENGLELTARAAAARCATVRLVRGDVFDETKLPSAAFDVVYSAGFVEHFPNAQLLMRRFANLLAPDGVVVTAVPNLCGLNGTLQRLVDEETFAKHVVLSPRDLDAVHAAVDLVPVEAAHFVGVLNLTAVNFSALEQRMDPQLRRALLFVFAKIRLAGECLGNAMGCTGGAWLAPMIGGVYRKRPVPSDCLRKPIVWSSSR